MKSLNILKGVSGEEIRLILLLGPGSFLLMSSISSINVALPDIQHQFGIGLSALKWVSIIGAIMSATLSLCFGRIGDIVGRKKVYKTGILLYALGSGLCATSVSFPFLMSFRIVMAVAVAMSLPLAAAIMAATVAPERRGQVLGLFASFSAAGMVSGPSLGGLILSVASWRAIFLTNAALALLLGIGQQFFLRGEDERRPQKFDLLGALLLLVGYPALLLGLSFGPSSGWTSPITLGWFLLAAVGLVSFVAREASFEAPLFRLAFFRSSLFRIAVLTLFVGSFVQSPITFFSPLFLRNGLGLRAGVVGLVLMALPISTMLSGPIGGRLADRYDPRLVAAAGIAITFAAIAIYGQIGLGSPVILVIFALALVGLGASLFRPANQVAVYASVARTDFGVVSAMLNSLGTLGGTLGTSAAVAFTEATTSRNDAAGFAHAQQTTFTALLPLLLLSLIVLLAGKLTRNRPVLEPSTVPNQVQPSD